MDLRDARGLLMAPRFSRLKARTKGMLDSLTYKRIYKEARHLPDYPFVEVGAAAGSATIALAWAYKHTGKQSKIIAIEKFEGGSRIEHGDFDDNLSIFTSNLSRFGVSESVLLYSDHCRLADRQKIELLIDSEHISGFMHDADGRIDRDFELFWDKTIPGGLIIVDDYENKPNYKQYSARDPDGGAKLITTFKLLNILIKHGFFQPKLQMRGTIFGVKPPDATEKEIPTKEIAATLEEIEADRAVFLARLLGGGLPAEHGGQGQEESVR
jgi:predicted O-methyltransferase YrrM